MATMITKSIQNCQEIGNENQSYVSIDIEKPDEEVPLVISLEKELSSWLPMSGNHCIYRVPQRLRTAARDGSLYKPKMVSIGPIHHGREGLEAMEEYKQRFLIDFLGRTGLKLEEYARFMIDREARLRECYSDTINVESNEFLKILMVDASFLVELLLKNDVQPRDDNCRIFGRPRMISDMIGDLILLENQLPLFILEDIFNSWIIRGGVSDGIDMTGLLCRFLISTTNMWVERYDLEKVRSSKPVHFLDCLRSCYIFAESEDPWLLNKEERGNYLSIHSATELHRAGLKFRRSQSRNLFSIKFEAGVLVVPSMSIFSQSETIYKNLLAFEQCHYPSNERLFAELFCLMDDLVNTPQDINLLVRNGIITHTLGDSNQAANVFNGISQGLRRSTKNRYFAGIYRDLTVYYDRPWNSWKATLKQNYFNTPWTIISVVAAAILLLLTVTQTVFSIVN